MPPITGWKSGVYRIRNNYNGKRYIGSSEKDIEARWSIHRATLRGGYHHSRHLQAAWNKYGEESFVFEVVKRCAPQLCLEIEQKYLDAENSANSRFGYNVLPTAGNPRGREISDETRAKLSAGRRGKLHTPESKAKMSASQKGNLGQVAATKAAAEANRGRKMTPETRAKMSASKRGIPKSEAHKAATSASHWSKGPKAEETKRKISETKRARKAALYSSQEIPRGSQPELFS